jgi:hypothetical protein
MDLFLKKNDGFTLNYCYVRRFAAKLLVHKT